MTDNPEILQAAEDSSGALLHLSMVADGLLDGEERDMIGRIRHACQEMLDGDRG